MKKIFFLLLVSIASYGQAEFPEGVQITGGQPTVTGVNFLTGTNLDGLQVKIAPVNLGFASDSDVLHRTGNETKTGNLTVDNSIIKNQTVNSKTSVLQQNASSDWYKIYQYFTTADNTELVFEVGDNGKPFASGGERFRFHYDATNDGAEKDPLIIDYNQSTFTTDVSLSNETASTIASFDSSKNVKSLPTSTYPNFTELSYLKGVTSSLQTQLNGKLTGSLTSMFLPRASGSNTLINSQFYDIGASNSGITNAVYSQFNIKGSGTGDTGGGIVSFENQTKSFAQISGETESASNGVIIFRSLTAGILTEKGRFLSDGSFRVTNLAGTGTRQVVADASGNLSATATVPESGTYTPTATAVANCSSITLSSASNYIRVGNIIKVSVRFSLTETSALSTTQFRVTLPVNRASSLGLGSIGTGSANEIFSTVRFDNANNSTVLVKYTSGSVAGASSGSLEFQYSVLD